MLSPADSRSRDNQTPLASWYTPGLSDGLGDRLLMFDNTGAPSWEILRFRPKLAAAANFEIALRERVRELNRFQHPSFSAACLVKGVGDAERVALASTYVPGVRLSQAFGRPRSATFALGMIRQLIPALVALQRQGCDVSHGALTAERIMVTPDGRLMIREHVLGSALQSLGLSAAGLWAEFGIVVSPPGDAADVAPRLEYRTDVIQLALVAVSLMLGRRVGPSEYSQHIDKLLDELAGTVGRNAQRVFPPLRHWLESALHLNGRAFDSAQEAHDACGEIGGKPHVYQGPPASGFQSPRSVNTEASDGHNQSATTTNPPAPRLFAFGTTSDSSGSSAQADENDRIAARRQIQASIRGVLNANDDRRWQLRHAALSTTVRAVAAVVALLAIGEAVWLARLLHSRSPGSPLAHTAILVESRQPGAEVWVDETRAGVTPIELNVSSQTHSIRVLTHDPSTENSQPRPTNAEYRPGTVLTGMAEGSGTVRFSSPIELDVLERNRSIGSTSRGPILLTAGLHELELKNDSFGYRSLRVVDVKEEQSVLVTVRLPTGTVSINALPWADVWIDGKAVGETPLGNLSVAVGEHHIVFRHPQLGEQRELITVRADAPTRISANLRH